MASQKKTDQQKAAEYLKKLEISKKSNEVNPFETKDEQNARIARGKEDVVYMVKTYLPHYALAECADFQIEFANMVKADGLIKAFAEWGRGLAKSVWCNIIIPLWLWMNGEDVFFCLISDSKERAEELISDVQAELEGNPLIIHDFGEQKSEGSWEFGNFSTIDQRFIGKSFGIKKKVRGIRIKHRRPTLWVIDDLETPDTIANPKTMRRQANRIERDVIPTMTDKKTRRLLYANNRFARVMTQTILQERHPKWVVHHILAFNPASIKPRWSYYTKDFYEQQIDDMGIVAALSEYCHITKLEGGNFSEEQIQWGKLPPLSEFKMIISHWDIAYTANAKSDYNAVKVWGLHNRNFWLIDCFVKQAEMKHPVAWMCDFKKSLPQGVNLIMQYEGQFWNGEVQRNIDEGENKHNLDLNLMKVECPKTNKTSRIITMQPYFQNSRIYYNEDLKPHNDTQVGIMQLCSVEEGSKEHDDSPDADHQAITALEIYCTPIRRNRNGQKSYRTGKMKHKYNMP